MSQNSSILQVMHSVQLMLNPDSNVYDRAIELIASGKVDLKPLISETFKFDDGIKAFERAAEGRPTDVKLQIKLA